MRTHAASCEEPEAGGFAPPCRPPRRKLALPTLTRKPINWDSREAMESSFSRVFPIPPSCRKAPPRRRSNIAEKSAEKSALAMILGLYRSDNFRKPSLTPPPPTFPPQLGAFPNSRERPQMAGQKRANFIPRNSEKARLAFFDQGFRRSRRGGRTPMRAKSPDSRPRPPEGERSNSSFPAPINTRKPRIRPSPSFETSAQTTSSLPQSEGEPRNARRDSASDGGAPHPAVPQRPGDKICGTSSRCVTRSDSGYIRGTAPRRAASPSARADRVGSVVYSDLVVKRCIGRRRRPPCPSAARRKGRM